jgi:hypothetical protein
MGPSWHKGVPRPAKKEAPNGAAEQHIAVPSGPRWPVNLSATASRQRPRGACPFNPAIDRGLRMPAEDAAGGTAGPFPTEMAGAPTQILGTKFRIAHL